MALLRNSVRPLVSVAILNWNGLEHTKACLESVRQIAYDNYEIIVVDNGSVDGSKEYLRRETGIILVDNPKNRGFAGGHIDALGHASGEYIFLLNNDAVVKPDIIEVALEDFASDPSIGAVGGRVYRWADDAQAYDEANAYYSYQHISPFSAEAFTQGSDNGVPVDANTVSGSGVFLRRSVIDDIGYLFEPFFAYYEETDLFARMKRHGYRVLYDPRAKIWHRDGASTQRRRKMFYYLMFRNRLLLAVRNFDRAYMGRMLNEYCAYGLRTSLRGIRSRDPRSMGEAHAFWSNALRAPFLLAQRRRFKRSGLFGYNDILLSTQGLPVSVVIDCRTGVEGVDETLTSLQAQAARARETVIIASAATYERAKEYAAVARIGVHKQVLQKRLENHAAVMACGDYLVFLLPGDTLAVDTLRDLYVACAGGRAQLSYPANSQPRQSLRRALRVSPVGRLYMLERAALMRIGGFPDAEDSALALHLMYARMTAERMTVRAVRGTMLVPGSSAVATSEIKSLRLRYRRRGLSGRAMRSLRDDIFSWMNRRPRTAIVPLVISYFSNPRVRRSTSASRLLRGFLAFDRKAVSLQLHGMRKELTSDQAAAISVTRYLETHRAEDSPVFIIARDRVFALRQLIAWLERAGMGRIVILDNDSSYPELLEYLEHSPHEVVNLGRNMGHTCPWDSGAVQLLAPGQFFVVTDPDIVPSEDCPTNAVLRFYELLARHTTAVKAGFGLRIDDLPDHYRHKDSVVTWEGRYWQSSLEPGVYVAPIDTTFALYRPGAEYSLGPGLRTGEPYLARHLPWYADSNELSKEDAYYRQRGSASINSWDADLLPERYQEALDRHRRWVAASLKRPEG